MQLDDCSTVAVIEGVNTCIIVINQVSWLDEINNLPLQQVFALLSATALIWYVASCIRTYLSVLAHDEEK